VIRVTTEPKFRKGKDSRISDCKEGVYQENGKAKGDQEKKRNNQETTRTVRTLGEANRFWQGKLTSASGKRMKKVVRYGDLAHGYRGRKGRLESLKDVAFDVSTFKGEYGFSKHNWQIGNCI